MAREDSNLDVDSDGEKELEDDPVATDGDGGDGESADAVNTAQAVPSESVIDGGDALLVVPAEIDYFLVSMF
ncbi:hypothetical protein HGRIS_010469 [Hohenbuehelia grisea]|uniref:Uncharacterized protein n=1 Tax=Hohenbuehelia grisea TaxID=104357 RepID=A0ABR3IZC4_9AGAR